MNRWELVLIEYAMIFCHIIDDYNLQGILASMKQKSWWENNVDDLDNTIYKHDYIAALLCHAFSWSCMIHLPILVYKLYTHNHNLDSYLVCSILGNFILHAIIDNLKANRKTINLILDQMSHIVQIMLTWIGFVMILSIYRS
jgi:hypothetical protein